MPTPEEIKKIAREYAKEILSKQPMKAHAIPEVWEKAVADTEKPLAELFEPLIAYLSKDYCIVPKEQIKDTYNNFANKLTDKFHLTAQERATANASIASALVNLFGTELFNEEKE